MTTAQDAYVGIDTYVGVASPITQDAYVGIDVAVDPADSDIEGIWDASALPVVPNGTALTAWPDTAGYFPCPFVTASPTYRTNVVNGKPVVRWSGAAMGFSPGMPHPQWTSFTIMALIKPASVVGAQTIVGDGASNGIQFRLDNMRPGLARIGTGFVATDTLALTPQISSSVFSLLTLRFHTGSRYRAATVSLANGAPLDQSGWGATNGLSEVNSGFWDVLNVSPSQPVSLMMEPLAPTALTSYTVAPRLTLAARAPKDFKLQGSDHAAGPWTDLDVRTGVTWGTDAPQTFSVSGTPRAYRFYQLYITGVATSTRLNILDVQLNSIPVRQPHFEFRLNGETHYQGVIDASLVSIWPATTPSFWIGARTGAVENYGAGDMAYLRITNGEVDLGTLKARENALLTAYGLTPADPLGKSVLMNQITSTGNAGAGFVESLLTNHAGGDSGNSWKAAAASPQTIVVTTATKAQVKDYWMQATAGTSGGAPKDFLLQGSNDGTTWTTVDSRSGLGWVANEKKNFTVATPAEYLYYRIVISATSDGNAATVPSLAELDLTGPTTIPPPVDYGGSSSYTFTTDLHLFGVYYAAGAVIPALSAAAQRALLTKGVLVPPGTNTVRKAMKVNGAAVAAGAVWVPGSVTAAQNRRLLRGKLVVD